MGKRRRSLLPVGEKSPERLEEENRSLRERVQALEQELAEVKAHRDDLIRSVAEGL